MKGRLAAKPFNSRDEIVEWIHACVLGDLRTLVAGIEGQAKSAKFPEKPLGGGNFLLVAGCCMALEYFGTIYNKGNDAVGKVREYAKRFLKPVNSRYADVIDLLWKSFRYGIIHVSWPQSICIEGYPEDHIVIGVGNEIGDEHLEPIRGVGRASLAINGRRFLIDLEESYYSGFKNWILKDSDDAILERAAPQLLRISQGDATSVAQLKRIQSWRAVVKENE